MMSFAACAPQDCTVASMLPIEAAKTTTPASASSGAPPASRASVNQAVSGEAAASGRLPASSARKPSADTKTSMSGAQ